MTSSSPLLALLTLWPVLGPMAGAPRMGAQPTAPPPLIVSTSRSAEAAVPSFPPGQDVPSTPWYAPALSAVLPGAGQGLLRQQRSVLYVAVEGYLVLRALSAQRDANALADEYREIARSVARAPFGGARPEGPWSYYERLQSVLESGAYNATPSAGFTPESDPSTFNGSIWLLARETFWRDPDSPPDPASAEYQSALAFYQRRAAGEEFRWSWRDAQLEQDLYRQTISRRNEASRRSRQLVGLLLANHALSMVDAYVAVRLRLFAQPQLNGPSQVGVAGSLPLPRLDR